MGSIVQIGLAYLGRFPSPDIVPYIGLITPLLSERQGFEKMRTQSQRDALSNWLLTLAKANPLQCIWSSLDTCPASDDVQC